MRGKKLPKVLLTLGSLASLAICIACVWAWARSFVIIDSYVTTTQPSLKAIQSYRGAVHYVRVSPERFQTSEKVHPREGRSTAAVRDAKVWQEWNGPRRDEYTFIGFALAINQNFTIMAIPYWPMVVLSAILPIYSFPIMLRWLRRASVQCPQCGKRTKGLVDKCPRCGHALVATGPPPPPTHDAPPPPRPSKRVKSVVVKSQDATPDRSHSGPTDGSDITF
jgi:hypothetical protein